MTDNSKNRQFLGEAAIGGLVGVSSANLNRCSAVVKLNINCTHRYASETNTGAMNKAQWGNYVRVGGLVGVLLSVPVASVLYALLRRDVHKRLACKE